MSLTYVIPDIHGRIDLLRDGLSGIIGHAAGRLGTIVALGDYVDKGPDSKAVIDFLLTGSPRGWLFFPLKGNHDAMMVEALRAIPPACHIGWSAAVKPHSNPMVAIPRRLRRAISNGWTGLP